LRGEGTVGDWFDKLTMANRNVILSLAKDPLTSIPFDRLTALSLSKGSPARGEED
jgi:hypothetical protein